MVTQTISAKTTVSLGTMRKLFANIVFLLSLFPYLTVLKVPWDTQPWALIFASAYVAFMLLALNSRVSLPRPLVIIILATLYGISLSSVFAIFDQVDTGIMLRRLVGYATVATVAYVAVNEHRNIWSGWLVIAVLAWAAIGLGQEFFGFNFVNSLLPRVSTAVHRGVISLAPEPSYYAIQIGFFMLLNEIFRREKRYTTTIYWVVLLLCVIQLFLSLSGTAFLLLIIFVISKMLSKWKMFGVIASAVIIILILITPFESAKNTRIYVVINELKNVIVAKQSFKTLLSDRSIAYRLINPVVGFYGGLVVSKGIGFGWGRITEEKFPQWLTKLLGPYRYSGGKIVGEWKWGGTIMGGLVAAVYELGLVGLLYIGVILRSVLIAFTKGAIAFEILFVTLILTFGGFISLAHPLLGYLIGLLMMYSEKC